MNYNLYVIMVHFLFKTGHKIVEEVSWQLVFLFDDLYMYEIMISQADVRDVSTETNKRKQQVSEELVTDKDKNPAESLLATQIEYQQLSEELKQANEKQKLTDTLLEENNEHEQIRQQLSEAKTLMETLRTENEEEAKLREESAEQIKRILYLHIERTKISSEKEELAKTLQNESQNIEALAKKLKAAQKSDKKLEEEMQRWLDDAKVERYKNTNTFNNLSECLNREIVHSMADVSKDLTINEKGKLENLLFTEG